MAEKGWYPLPSDPTKLMYFDGANFVGDPVVAPSAPTPAPVTQPAPTGAQSVVENLFGSAKQAAADKENQGTAMAIGGAAAIVDGAVGIGNRPGLFSAIPRMIFGAIFIVVGIGIMALFNPNSDPHPGEVKDTAVVSSMSYETSTSGTGSDRSTSTYCIAYIVSETGEEIPVNGNFRQSPCPYYVGETIDIYVNPDVPGSERIVPGSKKDIISMIFPWVFIGAGAMVALGAVGPILKSLGFIAGGATLLGFGLSRRSKAREEKERKAAADAASNPWAN